MAGHTPKRVFVATRKRKGERESKRGEEGARAGRQGGTQNKKHFVAKYERTHHTLLHAGEN